MTIHIWDKQGRYPLIGSMVHRIQVSKITFDITGVRFDYCLKDVRDHFRRLGFKAENTEVRFSIGQFIDLVDKIIE